LQQTNLLSGGAILSDQHLYVLSHCCVQKWRQLQGRLDQELAHGMSIAERSAVQTINGSEESMLDSVGGFHDRLPFFSGFRGPRQVETDLFQFMSPVRSDGLVRRGHASA
jgi:hypothetical protein